MLTRWRTRMLECCGTPNSLTTLMERITALRSSSPPTSEGVQRFSSMERIYAEFKAAYVTKDLVLTNLCHQPLCVIHNILEEVDTHVSRRECVDLARELQQASRRTIPELCSEHRLRVYSTWLSSLRSRLSTWRSGLHVVAHPTHTLREDRLPRFPTSYTHTTLLRQNFR